MLVGKKLLHNADVVDINDYIIIIEITVEMNKILIANIYAPQTCREKIVFFQEVQNVIEAFGPERNTKV